MKRKTRPWKLICAVACLFIFLQANAQEIDVSGVVTSETGETIVGANVVVEGTTTGTVTGLDGKYSITVPDKDATLNFSFVGYLTEKIVIGGRSTINVVLIPDIKSLDEVVVVGYGVQKKSDLTGAVATVSGDNINQLPVVSVDQALQGRAAGVSIAQNSGIPGGAVSIQIRGISSINGTEPLVIVDGVRASLSGINASDIESVEVLKDASSAAIYGASGGNGVILVNTKKGKSGKLVTNFNYYRGWQNPWKKMDMMNSQEYAELHNIIIGQSNQLATRVSQLKSPFTTRPDTLKNYDYQDLMMQTGIMENYDFSIAGGSEKSTFYISLNYIKQQGVLRKTDYDRLNVRINSDHKLSKIIKLGESVTFSKTKKTGFEEWQFNNSYNSPFTNILKMVPYLPPYSTRYDDTYSGASGTQFPLSVSTVGPVFKNPSDSLLDRKWSYHPNVINPQRDIDIIDSKRENYSVGGQVYVDLNLFKGFTLTSKVNAYTNFDVNQDFDMVYYYNPQTLKIANSLTKNLNQQFGWETQVYANYNRTLADVHNLGVMAGFESNYTKHVDNRAYGESLINETEDMKWYFNAVTNKTSDLSIPEGSAWETANYSYFGRINYDFRSKYLVTLNIRKDYSSRFGPKYRSGVFPSFSLGWKFSEEDFIKNLGFLSFGKIRFGYGQTGANAPANYAYYAKINSVLRSYNYLISQEGAPSQGATLAQLPNTELHWETMIMNNLGIDLGFFNNKLNLTVDLFRKISKDMIDYQTLPSTAGMYQFPEDVTNLGGDARPLVNFGKIENKGIEFTIGYRTMEGNLKAQFDFNGTLVRNKVLDLVSDSLDKGSVGVNLTDICLTAEGNPMAQFNGYMTDGLFTWADAATNAEGEVYIWNQPYTIAGPDTIYAQSKAKPGDFRFVDANGDGKINDFDRRIIGNPQPKFIMGFSTTLGYRSFDLNIFFEGKFGQKVFNGAKLEYMNQLAGPNRLKDVLDQYREPVYSNPLDPNYAPGTLLFEGNTDTDLPRLDGKSENVNLARVSDFFVEDGSYLRLKNIQLGYTIPVSFSSKIGIEKFRIFVGAKNLLTFTRYSGWDPEFDSSPVVDYASGKKDMLEQGIDRVSNYPQNRMFLVGVNLQF